MHRRELLRVGGLVAATAVVPSVSQAFPGKNEVGYFWGKDLGNEEDHIVFDSGPSSNPSFNVEGHNHKLWLAKSLLTSEPEYVEDPFGQPAVKLITSTAYNFSPDHQHNIWLSPDHIKQLRQGESIEVVDYIWFLIDWVEDHKWTLQIPPAIMQELGLG